MWLTLKRYDEKGRKCKRTFYILFIIAIAQNLFFLVPNIFLSLFIQDDNRHFELSFRNLFKTSQCMLSVSYFKTAATKQLFCATNQNLLSLSLCACFAFAFLEVSFQSNKLSSVVLKTCIISTRRFLIGCKLRIINQECLTCT